MICDQCRFDLEKLDVTLKWKETKKEDGQIVLFCPFCRERVPLDLKREGVFLAKDPKGPGDKIYRWKGQKSSGLADDRIEKGHLVVELERRDLETLDLKSICYPKVAVFRNKGVTGFSAPKSPVQKDFLKLVDIEKSGVPRFREEISEYEVDIFVRGIEEVETYRCQALAVDTRDVKGGAGKLIPDSYLAYWPKLEFRDWKRYFVRFGGPGSRVKQQGVGAKTVEVWAGSRKTPQALSPGWVSLSRKDGEEGDLVACVENRPNWVSVEYKNPSGEIVGGGIWEIEDDGLTAYPESSLISGMAVDFGTSNTFIAYSEAENPKALPVVNCTGFVFADSALHTPPNVPDTWPPERGFGTLHTSLPSEILTKRPLDLLAREPDSVRSWCPVVDFGIPTGSGDVLYSEKDHTIGEFKWQESVTSEAFRGMYQDLQQQYLEFLLLFACAQLGTISRLQRKISLKFSYPLAFSEHERDAFADTVKRAAEAVAAQTGIQLYVEDLLVDEAQAAARAAVGPSSRADLYLDIGGGSTDIAFLMRKEKDSVVKPEYAYIDSVRYAGAALLKALDSGRCLQPDLPKFRRLLREEGDVVRLQKRGNVFLPAKLDFTRRKTGFFYAFLREYVARLLAAHMVTGEWEKGRDPAEIKKIREGQDGYTVALYPFGNGWGFGNVIAERYPASRFVDSLSERVEEIVQEEIRARQAQGEPKSIEIPKVRIQAMDLEKKDPKSVVAFGLLTASGGRGPEYFKGCMENWSRFRTIVGCTTQVGSFRSIPWHVSISDGRAPEGQDQIPPGAQLDCPDKMGPSFPASLADYSPHELDRDLAKTRPKLAKCLSSVQEAGWFVKSPLQVLLEELFKPSLERI